MGEILFVDEQVRDNCWNLYDSYGEICVHCGCCSNDKKVRYAARVNCLKAWIAEKEAFDMWDDDPETRKIQEQNNAKTLRFWKRQLSYNRRKAREYA